MSDRPEINLDAIGRAAKSCEEAAFEEWLSVTRPSGDVTSVHNQWINSSVYADLYVEEAQHPAVVGELVRRLREAEMAAPHNAATRERVARAIWNIRREDEDRCDMELEDMGRNHAVWREADAAIAAMGAPK